MDLQEFVQATLVEISKGIQRANESLKGTDTKVNPKNLAMNTGTGANYGYIAKTQEMSRVVELVEFDVAVNVSEGSEKNGKIGISVGSVGLGVGGKSAEGSSSISKIRFKIPVAWPVSE
jgi:hypothetical protein